MSTNLARRALTTARAGLLLLTCAGLAACGVLPPVADPVPTSVTPTALAVPSPATSSDLLSPDGFDAVQRMAVRIRNVGCGRLSTGSGFALDPHTLVTNKHVVADSAQLQISTYDGHDLTASATSTAELADLALVRTDGELPSWATLADTDPKVGDRITVVGYPEGRALTVTDGTVVATTTDPLNLSLGEVLVTDAPVEPGSSGSAALDADGRVVGVVYAKSASGHSYLLPVSTLRQVLEQATFGPAPSCTTR
ncbi:MAG: serine protease [Micrococcales bacterium]|nr:serine protease [Micrococcales bacterium]